MTEGEWLSCAETEPMLKYLSAGAVGRKLRLFGCACCRRAWELIDLPCSRAAVEVAERFADGLASEEDRARAFAGAIRAANDYTDRDNRSDGIRHHFGPVERVYSAGVMAAALAVAEPNTLAGSGSTAAMLVEIAAELDDPEYMRIPDRVATAAAACFVTAADLWFRVENGDKWYGREDPDRKARVLAVGAERAAAVGATPADHRADWAEANNRVGRAEAKVQCDLLRDIFGTPFRPIAFAPEWRTDTAVAMARQMYEAREFGAMPILADALQDAGCDSEGILSHCRDANQVHVRGCWVVDLVLGKD